MAPYPTKPEIQDIFFYPLDGRRLLCPRPRRRRLADHGPLASGRGVHQQDRVLGRHTKLPGRQGADGAVEDVRRQCCRRRGRGYGGSGDERLMLSAGMVSEFYRHSCFSL